MEKADVVHAEAYVSFVFVILASKYQIPQPSISNAALPLRVRVRVTISNLH